MVRRSLALVLVFGLALPVLADVPPPPPAAGLKRVPLEHVLKLAQEMDDYEFYTFQRLGIGGKEEVGERLKVGTKEGVPVPSNQSPSVRTGVVAIPVEAMTTLGSTKKLAALLHRDNQEKLPAGLVVHETNGEIEDIPRRDSRKKVVNVITVSRDEKAGVRFDEAQQAGPPGAAPNKSSENSQPLPAGAIIAGVCLSLAIASAGVIFLRRKS